MQRPRPFERRGQLVYPRSLLAAGLMALTLALPAIAGPLAAAEWSRSVTVNAEVLDSLSPAGVAALPVRRGPMPGAVAVEYRWELLADLAPGSGGGGGATGAWSQGQGRAKAAPALIRPGQPPQWILGTGSR